MLNSNIPPPLALRNMHAPQSHIRVLARTAGCYAERGNGVSMPPRHGCKYLSHRLRAYRIFRFHPCPPHFPHLSSTLPLPLRPLPPSLPLLHPLCSFTLQKQVDEFCPQFWSPASRGARRSVKIHIEVHMFCVVPCSAAVCFVRLLRMFSSEINCFAASTVFLCCTVFLLSFHVLLLSVCFLFFSFLAVFCTLNHKSYFLLFVFCQL